MKKEQLALLILGLAMGACSPAEREAVDLVPPGEVMPAREAAHDAEPLPEPHEHAVPGTPEDPHAHRAPASPGAAADHEAHAGHAAAPPGVHVHPAPERAGHPDHAGHAAPARAADPAHAEHAQHPEHAPAAPTPPDRHIHPVHPAPAPRAEAAPADAHDHPVPAPDAPTAPGVVPDAPAIPAGLAELVSALLEDPAVQERIRQDPELCELWGDPAVQGQVSPPAASPGMMEPMRKVMEITRGLLADPQVKQRIQADPALRELWADPAVRQRVLGSHQH